MLLEFIQIHQVLKLIQIIHQVLKFIQNFIMCCLLPIVFNYWAFVGWLVLSFFLSFLFRARHISLLLLFIFRVRLKAKNNLEWMSIHTLPLTETK